jgi:hypothetical protein
MTKPFGGAPPQNTSIGSRKSSRIEKGRRAYAKSLVHLPFSYGHKIEFGVETRHKLLSVLNRLKPPPSARRATRMIGWAERVVSDLNAARSKIEQTTEADREEKALRNLLKCARKMREACSAASEHKQLSHAMNVRLMVSVVKLYDKDVDPKEFLSGAWSKISSVDFFGKFNRDFTTRLDMIIKTTSPLIDALDASSRIIDYSDHWNALVLASKWFEIIGEPATFMHLDREEEGRPDDPSPFQAFVAALPLDRPIMEEALRTAVEFVREFGARVLTTRE